MIGALIGNFEDDNDDCRLKELARVILFQNVLAYPAVINCIPVLVKGGKQCTHIVKLSASRQNSASLSGNLDEHKIRTPNTKLIATLLMSMVVSAQVYPFDWFKSAICVCLTRGWRDVLRCVDYILTTFA